jgi:hypothetical protein
MSMSVPHEEESRAKPKGHTNIIMEKPKRPLSSFNLFYRYKRSLLAGQGDIPEETIKSIISCPAGLEDDLLLQSSSASQRKHSATRRTVINHHRHHHPKRIMKYVGIKSVPHSRGKYSPRTLRKNDVIARLPMVRR